MTGGQDPPPVPPGGVERDAGVLLCLIRAGSRDPEVLDAASAAVRRLGEALDPLVLGGRLEGLEPFRRVQEAGAAWLMGIPHEHLICPERSDPPAVPNLKSAGGTADPVPGAVFPRT